MENIPESQSPSTTTASIADIANDSAVPIIENESVNESPDEIDAQPFVTNPMIAQEGALKSVQTSSSMEHGPTHHPQVQTEPPSQMSIPSPRPIVEHSEPMDVDEVDNAPSHLHQSQSTAVNTEDESSNSEIELIELGRPGILTVIPNPPCDAEEMHKFLSNLATPTMLVEISPGRPQLEANEIRELEDTTLGNHHPLSCQHEDQQLDARFQMLIDDEMHYFCSESCAKSKVRDNHEVKVTLKPHRIEELEDSIEKSCMSCASTKECKYKLNQLPEHQFICDHTCVADIIKDDWMRYALFVRKSVRESVKNSDSKIVPRTEEEVNRAKCDREKTFQRCCEMCQVELNQSTDRIYWELLDFCSILCLSDFQRKHVPQQCTSCKSVASSEDGLPDLTMVIRFGNDLHRFCSCECLKSHKRQYFVCGLCHNTKDRADVYRDDGLNIANTNIECCSRECLQKWRAIYVKDAASIGICHVCNHLQKIELFFRLRDQRLIELCSRACLSAFNFVNKVESDTCSMCDRLFERSSDCDFSIYNSYNDVQIFCAQECQNVFMNRVTQSIDCICCKASKYEYDLICSFRQGANQNDRSTPTYSCSIECHQLLSVLISCQQSSTATCDHCSNQLPETLEECVYAKLSDHNWKVLCSKKCAEEYRNREVLEVDFDKPVLVGKLKSITVVGQLANLLNRYKDQLSQLLIKPQLPALEAHENEEQQWDNGTMTPFEIMTDQSSLMEDPSVNVASTNVRTQIITVGPPPTVVRNCATMCRPAKRSRGVTCAPKTKSVECQTDISLERRLIIPIPVPIYVPTPLPMYSLPVPMPVPIAIPIPVPIFIPTTRNSVQGIIKEIRKVQERMPADPYEAELLLMAEMVAEDRKSECSDSEDEFSGGAQATAEKMNNNGQMVHNQTGYPTVSTGPTASSNTTEVGDDMLMMALKMTYDEPVVDLESAMTANAIQHQHVPNNHHVHHLDLHHQDHIHQQVHHEQVIQHMPHQQHMLILEQQQQQQQQHQLLQHQSQPSARGQSTRGRKRGSGGTGRGRGGSSVGSTTSNKRLRSSDNVNPEIVDTQQRQVQQQQQQQQRDMEKAEQFLCLKYTFGVNAWKQWVLIKNAELEKNPVRRKLFKTDLLQLTADELNYSLSLFVKEVRKPNGTEYAPDTIYYLVLGIQQYLYENGRIDNIFTDIFYESFTNCLDEVAKKFSILYNDSQYIVTRVEEEHLWECKQLGAHSPQVLLSTLMFFNTKYFNLTTVEEHMQLSFSHIMKHWKRGSGGGSNSSNSRNSATRNVLLRFYPPQVTLDANSRKKKVYEQQENEENPLRCPVKLYEFYLSKCPESVKTRNDVFYLMPERSCVPDSPVWYSTQALAEESLTKMLHRVKMVKEINIALLTS